jgi:TRAP-type C4-dicarboxylate transport system permease small subunit
MDRITRTLFRLLEDVLGYVFLVITLATIILVVLRYFFQTTIVGGQEFAVYCFIYTTALGAAVLLYRGEHIAVEVFQDLLPPVFRRGLQRINLLLVALLNGALVVLSVPWIRSIGDFPSPVLRIPQGIVLVGLPLGCGLAMLCALWLAFAARRSDDSAEAGSA